VGNTELHDIYVYGTFEMFFCVVLSGLQVEGIHRKDGQHSVVSRLFEQFTAGVIFCLIVGNYT